MLNALCSGGNKKRKEVVGHGSFDFIRIFIKKV
jgi:hypothetical protein